MTDKIFFPRVWQVAERMASLGARANYPDQREFNMLEVNGSEYTAFLYPIERFKATELIGENFSELASHDLPLYFVRVIGNNDYLYAAKLPHFKDYIVPGIIDENHQEELPEIEYLSHAAFREKPKLSFEIEPYQYNESRFYEILENAILSLLVIDKKLKEAYEFKFSEIRKGFNLNSKFDKLNTES